MVHHANAGAPVDGRDDGGVVQVGAGVGDRRIVLLELRGELSNQRVLRIDGLLRHDVAPELGIALEVALGILELDLIESLLGDRLVELGLIRRGVYLGQHVALPDLLALLEIDAQDAAIDLRPHDD